MKLYHVLPTHLDFAFVLERRGQVVGKLHSQPRLGRAAERLREPDSHLRTDAGLAIYHIVERLPSDAEDLSSFSHRQAQGFEASVPNASAGMGWIFHGHRLYPFHASG